MNHKKRGGSVRERSLYGWESARWAVALGLGAVSLVGATPAGGGERTAHPLGVGVVEDQVRSEDVSQSAEAAARVLQTGFGDLKVTVPWSYPGQAEVLNDQAMVCNAAQQAGEGGMGFTLNVIPSNRRDASGKPLQNAPRSPSEIRRFATTMGAWIHTLHKCAPDMTDWSLEIPNEPNSKRFWRPQLDSSGNRIAAKDVARTLAASYKVVKNEAAALGVDVTVLGGGLASNKQPLRFISEMGKAKKELGLGLLMDKFSYHPYPKDSAEPPSTKHPDGSIIGFGDYDQLVQALDDAKFGYELPIVYSEFGYQSSIPGHPLQGYTSGESKPEVTVSEKLQAQYYAEALGLAACSPRVETVYIFHNQDDSELSKWQSGLWYEDGTPKSSQQIVKEAIARVRSGNTICSNQP